MQHEQRYIRVAPLVISTLVMLGLMIAGAMLSADVEADRVLAIRLILAGVGIGAAGVLALPFCISRRSWAFTGDAVVVRQGLALIPRRWAREWQVPLADVTGLERSHAGAREVLWLRTRAQGMFSAMMPGDAPIVTGLLAAVGRVQGRHVALREALGFWAGAGGVMILVVALVFSLVIAGAALMAVLDRSMDLPGGSASGKGFAMALVLPFGLGYALVQVMNRRAAVLAANAKDMSGG
jgi:hypothetical protein